MTEPTAIELSQDRSRLANMRSHLANERTHLAYLRTGISLISFGVTLNRFSLYLIQNDKTSSFDSRPFLLDTKNIGMGMVALGSLLLIWASVHFLKTAREISTMEFSPSKWSILLFTFLVVLVGTYTTYWMIINN